MPKPFDASAKKLVDYDPVAFLKLAGLPGESAEIADSDMSTVQLAADRLLQVTNPRYLSHFEFQSNYDRLLPRRMRAYNVQAGDKYDQDILSTAILLREEADGPAMTGRLERPRLAFEYGIIRVWQMPPEIFLADSPALWPLAPIADVPIGDVPRVIRQIGEQVMSDVEPEDRQFLWTATYFMMGLKYNRTQLQESIRGVLEMIDMRDSDTYLAVLEEGEGRGLEEGLARGLERGLERGQQVGKEGLVARLIRHRLGDVPAATLRLIEGLTATQLDDLGEALLDFGSQADLDEWLSSHQRARP